MTSDRHSAYFGRRNPRSRTSAQASDRPASKLRAAGDLHAELRDHISTRFGTCRHESHGTAGMPELRGDSMVRMIETRYQPIVRMDDRQAVGLEVLARLNHPAWGFLLPEMFIPEIESAGLSPQLTDVVTARALCDLESGFLDRHGISLAINLPLDVLLFPAAFDRMEMQREWAGLDAARLTIELTESRPIIDLQGLTQAIERWRRAGYRLAIDDVAPNIADDPNLFKLPFNSVKLDKDVVQASVTSEAARIFIERIVTAAHAEGLSVTAEGVEDDGTWTRMDGIGADEAQGYLIAQPLAPESVSGWLRDWQRRIAPGGTA